MAKEMRRVLLSEAEFETALKRFVKARDQMFHGATLLDSGIKKSDPLEVEVVVRTQTGQEQFLTLGPTHLAAAVIRFCMDNRIPLPRNAEKSVKAVSGGIALDMHIELNAR